MKKYQIIFIVFLMILLTGCQSKTNITINKDLSVIEETYLSESVDFWSNFYMTSPSSLISDALNSEINKKFLSDNQYNHQIEITDNFKGVIINKKFFSLEDYSKNSVLYSIPFEKLVYNENDNIISLKTEGFKPYKDVVEELDAYTVENAKINVFIPYVVTDHNADKVDKINNVFTWEINKDTTNKSIILEFDQSRLFLKHLDLYISLGIILLLLVIIGVWYLRIRRRNKINNRI